MSWFWVLHYTSYYLESYNAENLYCYHKLCYSTLSKVMNMGFQMMACAVRHSK
jgi:hypothetical protein